MATKKGPTDSQAALFKAVIKQIADDNMKSIDWEKVAQDTGQYSNGANARTMFKRFKAKLIDSENEKSNGDEATGAVDKTSTTKKRAPKTKSAEEKPSPAKGGKRNGSKKAKKSEETVKAEDEEEEIPIKVEPTEDDSNSPNPQDELDERRGKKFANDGNEEEGDEEPSEETAV